VAGRSGDSRPHAREPRRCARGGGECRSNRGAAAMSSAWTIVVGAGLATVTLKAFGPVLLGARQLPPSLASVLPLLGPALLAGLVASQVLTDSRRLVLDERVVAVGLAAVAVWRWKV